VREREIVSEVSRRGEGGPLPEKKIKEDLSARTVSGIQWGTAMYEGE